MKPGLLSSLNSEHKEAIGLLQIGTFLEYFDLMLYVHMAVLLNELFFPKTDPHTAALLTAFAFCSTYVLRPFGALIFGWIGDNIGRRTTVIITTMMMAFSCIIMANLPTYAQIGITATWIVTACRIIQGLSSLGEIVGAEIYITELTKPPLQYVAVSLIPAASSVGAAAALGIATLVTRQGFNWRIAFWFGAAIAAIGSVARSRLRETPDFVQAKQELSQGVKAQEGRKSQFIGKTKPSEKINKLTFLSCFFIHCGWPLTFYLAYMYFHPILQKNFGYSAEDIILHNFLVSLVYMLSQAVMCYLCYVIFPLKILRVRCALFFATILSLPYIVEYASSPAYIFLLQSALVSFPLGGMPADAILIKHFPIFKRFTSASFLYALSRAFMYIITSFGLVYLTEFFGEWGVLVISIPMASVFMLSVKHFETLERDEKEEVIYLPHAA